MHNHCTNGQLQIRIVMFRNPKNRAERYLYILHSDAHDSINETEETTRSKCVDIDRLHSKVGG